jgi:Asp-tRNA(Asn)/Glu-tRNA(Gln) amidotransferase C subunit
MIVNSMKSVHLKNVEESLLVWNSLNNILREDIKPKKLRKKNLNNNSLKIFKF